MNEKNKKLEKSIIKMSDSITEIKDDLSNIKRLSNLIEGVEENEIEPSYTKKLKDKKINIDLFKEKNHIIIKITDMNDLVYFIYIKSLSLEELRKANNYFIIMKTIDAVFLFFTNLLNENKFKIYKNENKDSYHLTLLFNTIIADEILELDIEKERINLFVENKKMKNTLHLLESTINDNKTLFENKLNETTQLYENKINENKTALDSKIDEKSESLENKIDENINELDSKIDETNESLENKINENKNALDSKIDEKSESLENKINENKRALDSKIDEKNQSLKNKIENIENEVERIKNFNNNIIDKIKSETKNYFLNLCWPIGSYYWTNQNINPENLFGGQWKKIEGKFIYAADSNRKVDSTGGQERVTLSINEMPSHQHTPSGGGNFLKYKDYWGVDRNGGGDHKNFLEYGEYVSYTSYTGGSQSHENMPPYIAAFCWKRTG